MKKIKKEKKKTGLTKYLLSHFLLTLILVGISQTVINLVLRSFVIPAIETYLGIEGILTGKGLGELIKILVGCIMIIIIQTSAGSGFVLEMISGSKVIGALLGDELHKVISVWFSKNGDPKIAISAFVMILLFVTLVAVWVLPYVVGAVIYSKRISKRVKELEQERIEQNKEYERARNLLLSDITHDIKTPITTVAGFSKALTDKAVPEEQQGEYLEAIYNKSMRVSDLVSLLFEYVKLDSTGYVLNRSVTDMSELLREVVAELYTEFEEKNLQLDPIIPEQSMYANVDRMQIERALNNILSNTLKYNPCETKVEISLEKHSDELILQVSDNGTQIDREDAIHIFEPFYRADKVRKSGSGNGLGLSITKKIVEMHGGKIILIRYLDPSKHDGKIKTFEIRLPAVIKK